ncbi:hypothetical protein HPP92_009887 [Vanilla planifolia]|uniref:Uncharacterized protein n=1 Tax=Vanilla planifolia TaxID=51239 RepID=A0A835R8H0_VANPL|nr:hypothetical protein HPP92_009887 [Vanilla planifolia]
MAILALGLRAVTLKEIVEEGVMEGRRRRRVEAWAVWAEAEPDNEEDNANDEEEGEQDGAEEHRHTAQQALADTVYVESSACDGATLAQLVRVVRLKDTRGWRGRHEMLKTTRSLDEYCMWVEHQ